MSLSLREVLDAMSCSPSENLPFVIGKNYLFRTIGYHWLGKFVARNGKFLTLEDATWVADSGRYSEAVMGKIEELESSELEPVNRPVFINFEHITDAVEYPFAIPRNVK